MFFIVEFKNRSAGFAVIFVGKLKSSSTSAAVILFAAVDGFDPDFFAGLEAVAQRKAERAVVAPLIETCVGVVLLEGDRRPAHVEDIVHIKSRCQLFVKEVAFQACIDHVEGPHPDVSLQ